MTDALRRSPATDQVSTWEQKLCTPRHALRAWVLILLHERPAHGYDLTSRLDDLGFVATLSRVYRALQVLDMAALAEPTWQTGEVGPARRVFTITHTGKQALEIVVPALRRRTRSLHPKLARRMAAALDAVTIERRAFEITVTAQVSVHARDEAAARRKLERIFARRGVLDVDVRTTGEAAIRVLARTGAPPAPGATGSGRRGDGPG